MRKIHLVGIKGVAMAAMAVYLKESGIKVTGSDVAQDFPTKDELHKIKVFTGFDASRIQLIKPDGVYYTGAHGGRDNPEVVAAIAAGIPALPHGKALGEIMKNSRQIVVAGSHGKTTTSAMVAKLMTHAKVDPSFAIGCGAVAGLGPAGHKGKGAWFIAEGDEYVTDPGHDSTPRFHWLEPEILVITNIDYDHPDAYPNLQAVQDAFVALKNKSKTVIVNADDPESRMIRGENVITYGFSPESEFRLTHVGVGSERMFFTMEEHGMLIGEFTLKVPGRHNVLNAASALIAAHMAGVPWDELRKGLLTFTGTKRRFEKLGEVNGITFYDDYAHHPREIEATLAAARSWYPHRKIIAVFQPHTYSRTKALLPEFAKSFHDADTVILTDIYASSREHDTLGLNGKMLVSETVKNHRNVLYAKDKTLVKESLQRIISPGDVVIFMGAGDIYEAF